MSDAEPSHPGEPSHLGEPSHVGEPSHLGGPSHVDGPGHVGAPAWRRQTSGEHRWPAAVATLAAIGLQLALPIDLAFRPKWVLAAVELALFAVLVLANPTRINRESAVLRVLSLSLIAVVSLATAYSAAALAWLILGGHSGHGGPSAAKLLVNGGAIWLTNVIVFALWYWESDRGGPASRATGRHPYPDFLFSEMSAREFVHPDWEPTFVDYLFLSFTNASAFSPTDTMPLSRWAKLAMMFQSGVSLVTVVLVVARAVNALA